MADSRFDVVIIGAGPAGAALALALSGQGLSLAVIEARPIEAPELPTGVAVADYDPRVSALTPRSRALLEELGVWPAIEGYRCCPYRHMTVWDAEGTGSIEFDHQEVDADALGYITENRGVVAALVARMEQAPDIALLGDAALVSMQRSAAGEMQLVLANDAQLSAGLVVAADGALSRVRDMMGFATREWDYGHQAIVATVALSEPHRDTAWQRFTPTGPLALLPLPGADNRRCSIVWSQQDAVASELLALDDAEFCSALGRACESTPGDIVETSARLSLPLRQRHAIDYVQPGVALVADAAHTIHPLAGQGANLGFQDVAALAEELIAGIARGEVPGDEAALLRYQRRRKGENLLMMAAMDGFKRLFEHPALPLRWLRNAGLRQVDRALPLKRQLMRHAMGMDG